MFLQIGITPAIAGWEMEMKDRIDYAGYSTSELRQMLSRVEERSSSAMSLIAGMAAADAISADTFAINEIRTVLELRAHWNP